MRKMALTISLLSSRIGFNQIDSASSGDAKPRFTLEKRSRHGWRSWSFISNGRGYCALGDAFNGRTTCFIRLI